MELWIILGVLGAVALLLITIYNRLVALRQNRKQSFADIDVQLKQRFDLIPQLVETVKGYAGHEKTVFENITAARTSVQGAKGLNERVEAENMLSRAMMNLYAVAENYPNLKADGTFRQLMADLSDIENKIAAARRFFNSATAELNAAIQQFPAVLFAGALGFHQEEFFEIPDADRATYDKPVQVKFGS